MEALKVQGKIIHLLTINKGSFLTFNQIISKLPEHEPSFIVEVIHTLQQEDALSSLHFIDYDFMCPENLYPGRACALKARTKGALCIVVDEAMGEEEFVTNLIDLGKEIDRTLNPLARI